MPEIAPLPGVPGAAGPILVVGTAVVARVARLGAPPVAGGKLDGAGRGARLGGGAANAAVALARAGHPVRLVATLGADAAGDRVAAELRDAGVDIGLLRRAPGATPETLVLVDPSGERTIVRAAADPPAPLPEGLRAAAASCIFARGDAPGLAGLLRQRCSSCLVVAHVPPGGAGARPAHVLVGGASDLDASFLADPLEAGRRAAGDALRWVVVTRGAAGAEGWALFFDPSSVEEIAQAMKSLWSDDDLCIELSRRGLTRSSRWNQSHFNERLQDIMEKVLEGEQKAP